MLDLAEKGLLKKEKEGREFVFVPSRRLVERLRGKMH